jgi:hypothetical protein
MLVENAAGDNEWDGFHPTFDELDIVRSHFSELITSKGKIRKMD